MYQVILSPRAAKFFESADAPLQRKLDRCFNQLKQDPHHHNNIKSLKGIFAGQFRYRVGDYRVIFKVDDATNLVLISVIAHRRDVYE